MGPFEAGRQGAGGEGGKEERKGEREVKKRVEREGGGKKDMEGRQGEKEREEWLNRECVGESKVDRWEAVHVLRERAGNSSHYLFSLIKGPRIDLVRMRDMVTVLLIYKQTLIERFY